MLRIHILPMQLEDEIEILTKSDIHLKGIVHFEIKMWYLSAYPKGIQDVGVFFLQ